MIRFILNDKSISTALPSGSLLLDFIRDTQRLKGTKIGCREGDCGACTVLIGTVNNGQMTYHNVTSCLYPLANVHGKHVVTIEGLNMPELTPTQKAMASSFATQCGFCTVGFVVSLTGFCLSNTKPSYTDAIAAISGNICRCTGYKSIELAAKNLVKELKEKETSTPVNWLVQHGFIPTYFNSIAKDLEKISPKPIDKNGLIVGGGTDLYVQKHEELTELSVRATSQENELKFIRYEKRQCTIGAAVTVEELSKNEGFKKSIPSVDAIFKLISSAPIRNMSTLVGNFVNASPIGDLTALFLALNASLCIINSKNKERFVLLKDFYLAYKKIDLKKGEHIQSISFEMLSEGRFFNFEKVSKRLHLDIASVNSAAGIHLNGDVIEKAHISAGGVGPTPIYLRKTCRFLEGKTLSEKMVLEASELMQTEVSPMSDVRGSENYKRLLLKQLFLSHFLSLFPEKISFQKLLQNN